MSYIVTARKWRPQRFADVISQKHVTTTLQSAIRNERVGHAYLFSGPRGVGKTTIARIFAKALNCVHGPAEEPCNQCENCLGIQSGTSLDIIEIDAASHRKVEDARDLIESIGYHATGGRFKIYIIDEVHMLTKDAFNTLLKTIEEPPPNFIFIFATTEPQKVLPTILSRCQRFDFHRLSVQDITQKLRTIAQSDGIDIDDAAIKLIARRATGAMRDAESIMEQIGASYTGTITTRNVQDVLGIADRQLFFDMVDRFHEHDTAGALDLFIRYYDGGGDLKEFLEGLLMHFRDMLYVRYESGEEQITVPEDMLARLTEQSGWFPIGDIVRMVQIVTDVESSLRYAVVQVLRVEIAIARLSMLESTIELKDLFEQLGGQTAMAGNAGTVSQPGTPVSSPMPSNTASSQPARQAVPVTQTPERASDSGDDCMSIEASLEAIGKAWSEIVHRAASARPGVGHLLTDGVPEKFENGKLTVRFPVEKKFQCSTLDNDRHDIEEIISALLDTSIKLHLYVADTETKKKNILS